MGIFKRHPALFLGLGIMMLVLVAWFVRLPFMEILELKYYDFMMGLRGEPADDGSIVMVDIDEEAIEKLGRWPWPRALIAQGIDKIDAGNPRVIGLNLLLTEPEKSDGLRELAQLKQRFEEQLLAAGGKNGRAFLNALTEAQKRLDNDRKLEKSLRASGKVVLPVFFKDSRVGADARTPAEAGLAGGAVAVLKAAEGGYAPIGDEIVLPIAPFMAAAKGIGHFNLVYDMDGTARRERLLYAYRNLYIPSYTLRLAAAYLNLPLDDVTADLGAAIHMGDRLSVPTTRYCELLVNFKGQHGSFKSYSFFDVVNDKIPLSVFQNKLVLVSPSAAGIMNPMSTPTDPTMPVGEFSAHTLWTMLNKRFVERPAWADFATLGLILIIGLTASLLLPRLKAMLAGIVFVGLCTLLIAGSIYLFVAAGAWVPTIYPLTELVLGYIGIVSISYLITETHRDKVEGESAETNRMLGLSFQSQGMLDMAFDKFRRVPVDQEMKTILYSLAQDYERKRQINKAAAVYEYIEEHDSRYKDVAERKKKLMQASETMVFGDGLLGGSTGDNLMASGSDVRPTLGRYEIIRQLGRGAMGIVYLGQDPRINRTTAIKTFRFTDDFDEAEVKALKDKFFREAESAGTLSHPNIVTIYDAGDEQDLAYIAMEYLEGEDLEKFIKKGQLLPMRKVIDYVADIAEGLDYAHNKGIVHRDIKPANIMLLKSGVVKITDFGIARITATSQTQTGIVKGTPYYMSPEQFSGKKVDGRSDIFSLGVMLYQLLTGTLPFFADNPAALMNKIMNVPHVDPRTVNPKIMKPMVQILNKALAKTRDQRYQRAVHMAAHLRQTGKHMDALVARRKTSASTAAAVEGGT